MAKYIFVTGGVTSSLGKGIIAASLAKSVAGKRPEGNHSKIRSLYQC